MKHVNGFAVRLHNLGDFYSVEYVELWRKLLERHPALHVWGYSARWQVESDPIAAALASLASDVGWDRFAVRLSNAPSQLAQRFLSSTLTMCQPMQPSARADRPHQILFNLCAVLAKRAAHRVPADVKTR